MLIKVRNLLPTGKLKESIQWQFCTLHYVWALKDWYYSCTMFVWPLEVKVHLLYKSWTVFDKTKLKLVHTCHLLSSSGQCTTLEGQRSSSSSSSIKTKLKGRHRQSSSGYRASPLSVRPLRVKGPPTTPARPRSSPPELQWSSGVPSQRTTPEGQRSSNNSSSKETKLTVVTP